MTDRPHTGLIFQVGERLGRYEVEKRCAVKREDYDLAKQKKQQMEDYRLKVYQQLELHNLLDPELAVSGASPGRNPWAPLEDSCFGSWGIPTHLKKNPTPIKNYSLSSLIRGWYLKDFDDPWLL